jgi:hypothetical protein
VTAIEAAVDAANRDLLPEWLQQIATWEESRPGDECPYVPQHNCM